MTEGMARPARTGDRELIGQPGTLLDVSHDCQLGCSVIVVLNAASFAAVPLARLPERAAH